MAVLLADDEAVLVANRLAVDVPVVDEVDVEAVLAAERLAVEVSEDGRPLQMLPDPLKLGAALALGRGEIDDAAKLAPLLFDSTNAVVGLGGAPAAGCGRDRWLDRGGRRSGCRSCEVTSGCDRGASGRPARTGLPPDGSPQTVDDLWTVDLAEVAAAVHARRAGARSRPVSLAALRRDAPYVDPAIRPLRPAGRARWRW
jgi:hypothetical protein